MSSSSMQPRDNPNLIYSSSLRATLLLLLLLPTGVRRHRGEGKNTPGCL